MIPFPLRLGLLHGEQQANCEGGGGVRDIAKVRDLGLGNAGWQRRIAEKTGQIGPRQRRIAAQEEEQRPSGGGGTGLQDSTSATVQWESFKLFCDAQTDRALAALRGDLGG